MTRKAPGNPGPSAESDERCAKCDAAGEKRTTKRLTGLSSHSTGQHVGWFGTTESLARRQPISATFGSSAPFSVTAEGGCDVLRQRRTSVR